MTKKQKKMLSRIILAALMLIILHFIPLEGALKFGAYIIPYLIIGYDIIKKAFFGLINLKPFDESLLMTIATLGAIALALYQQSKGLSANYSEAIAVMLFYQIGELFQNIAVGKSRKDIAKLMEIKPDYANIEQDGKLVCVCPNLVEKGSIIFVKPGEKVPIDGIIKEGSSVLNTSAISGESIPKEVEKGDTVYSGSVNLQGLLKIKTTKEFNNSTASKVLELIENASSKKSQSENFISKFARVYTPIVVISALVLAILPPLVGIFFLDKAPMWNIWIYRALTFLVISCPCALVVSIPLTFFSAIGGASRQGILIKGSNYIETLSKVNTVIFDKTGTLTQGAFEVSAIHHSKIDEDKLLEYAVLAECASVHPIAQSLRNAYKYYNKELDLNRVTNFKELSGSGIIACIDNLEIILGSEKIMKKYDIEPIMCHSSGTIIHIALDRKYCGHIVITDIIKPDSALAIKELKKMKIKNLAMLSGDIKKAVEDIANVLGIDKAYSELLPNQKVEILEKYINEGNKTAFVGDGINDAPVLARADVGIAMGAIGSDAAIEAADVVLVDDNPMKIASAVKISKKCLNIVKQNICFALFVKFICLILGAVGVANMWLAVFADVGVMVICVINSFRALFVKRV